MIQLQVLNKLLDTGDSSLLLLNNIDSEFFSDYRDEFKFIKEHLDTYGKIPDKETFLSKFNDFDMIVVNEPNSYLINELYKDRNLRSLANTFNKVKKLSEAGRVDDAMNLYLKAAEEVAQAKHLECVDILANTQDRYSAYLERGSDYDKFYVRTGFTELDEIIGGWDRKEELATIAARTNQGKSWLLLKCAVSAMKQGLKVGIYSGEMSENKVGYRIDTLISHLSNRNIIRGNRDIQNEYKRYIETLSNKELYPGSIKVLTPPMIGGPAGVTALRSFIEKEDLDILFVDQHSLLEDDRHAKNPVEKASNISKDLKNLQVLKKIPIVSVSQQNRASTENGVDTSHIAQSDRIAQDSTVIIFFEQKDGVLTLNLVKSRDSANMKKLEYAIDLDHGIFTFLPSEEDGLNGSHCKELVEEFESDEF